VLVEPVLSAAEGAARRNDLRFRISQQDRLLREAAARAEQSFGLLAKVDSVIRDIRVIRGLPRRTPQQRRVFKRFPNFPCNLRPNFRLYISNCNHTNNNPASTKKGN
jgi:hypothetical protein